MVKRMPPVPLILAVTLALIGLPGSEGAPPAPAVAADFVAPGPVEPLPREGAVRMASIRAEALAAHIAFLASPALEGRGLTDRGVDAAAEYAASALALAGIPPFSGKEDTGGRAAYYQQVPLRDIRALACEVLVERRAGGRAQRRSFRSPADCVIPEIAPQSLEAPVVFAGYGIREAKLGRDDYRGLDVRGKAVLVLGGLPPGSEWQTPEFRARYGSEKPRERWAVRSGVARDLGAAAILAVDEGLPGIPSDDLPAERFFLPFDAPPGDETPLVRVSRAVADTLLAAVGKATAAAGTAEPYDLAGAAITIHATGNERFAMSRNVVGVLPGADPRLCEEAVVIGAHLDHLGKTGEVVYPGADDNASGVAALIEIARAFAASSERLRRTVVFAFWTGEEEGKLGSGYWVRHPLWPLQRTVAYLNLDMLGHPWSAEEIAKLVEEAGLPDAGGFIARVNPMEFAEPGLPLNAPAIETALRRAARAAGMALHLDRTDGTNGGSDYRDFARAHVAFVRFFGNFFAAYHQPGDRPETLDAGQVARMARLAFATAWLLADPPKA